jgi:hypothetical protein
MFDKYDKKTQRRIKTLFCTIIDTNVKLGISEPKKITDNFLNEIRRKELDTWKSLREYLDSTYFYNQCVKYCEDKVEIYKDRYKEILDKGIATEGQVSYLTDLIEKSLKHSKYKIRMDGLEELRKLLATLSKGSASYYIKRYKNILGYSKKNKDKNKDSKIDNTNLEE